MVFAKRNRFYSFMIFFSRVLSLEKYNNLIFKRDNRKLGLLIINCAFSLLISYINYFVFVSSINNNYKILPSLITISIILIIFAEIMNIQNFHSKENIFSKKTVEIFPLSSIDIFKNIFIANLLRSRILIYFLPTLVIIYFVSIYNVSKLIVIILIFLFLFLIITLFYSVVDYFYGILKHKFNKTLDKIFLLLFLLIFISFNYIGKHAENIFYNNDSIVTIVNYFLNK